MHCLLLAERDKESVSASAEKPNLKDCSYILADAWETLKRQVIKCMEKVMACWRRPRHEIDYY